MKLTRLKPGQCAICTFAGSYLGAPTLVPAASKRWIHLPVPVARRATAIMRWRKAENAARRAADFYNVERQPRPSDKTLDVAEESINIFKSMSTLKRFETRLRGSHRSGKEEKVPKSAYKPKARLYASKSLKLSPISYNSLVDLIWEEQKSLADTLKVEELALWRIDSTETFEKWSVLVRDRIRKACERKPCAPVPDDPLFHRLQAAFIKSGSKGVKNELRYLFQKIAVEVDRVPFSTLRSIADLCYPAEWFPETRQIQRKIHLHVGPTNSGKTYQALKKLEEADSGFYAGPLRLLAHEVYTRLNARGKLCALVTGEERRIPEGQVSVMSSCTVEMLPLNTRVDVAVIDEIQMLSSPDRGWAWTNAFLGVQANEVHLCGELRTIPLIQELCKLTGESLEIHNYERLTPLKSMGSSLKGSYKNLQKGDCIIAFSRIALHLIKKDVEVATGRRCAVVYGSLPPETRTQQSALFNDPDNDYDFLAASDAVGMGLNLSIKRIVFHETQKFDGDMIRTMATSELKQIAGRAGRFRTAAQDNASNQHKNRSSGRPTTTSQSITGLVSTFEDFDLPVVTNAMDTEAPPLTAAAIMPTDDDIVRFASYYPPRTPLSFILQRMAELSSTSSCFFFTGLRDLLEVADCIQPINLTLRDRLKFISSPASVHDTAGVVRKFAECVANHTSGDLLDIPELPLELLDLKISDNKNDLRHLESLHKSLTLYLWLSYRFPTVFRSQALAFHVTTLCEEKINAFLGHVSQSRKEKMQRKFIRRMAAQKNDLKANKREHALMLHLSGRTSHDEGLEANKLENSMKDSPIAFALGLEENTQSSANMARSIRVE